MLSSATSDKQTDEIQQAYSEEELSNTKNAITYGEDFSSTRQKTVGEEAGGYTPQTSSINRSVSVDVVNGKKPARRYALSFTANKSKIFEVFQILQNLSDKADDMTINIEIRAHSKQEFNHTWIRNAIEEPLDEMDIQANTRLE